ncbi:L,D-transpeptidase [Cohnella sp. GCM10027633]|uniref:L,D-transpeptidase n=1 Tax=unclassified Cohnella TaxID=2636738 RepID=UPI003644A91F
MSKEKRIEAQIQHFYDHVPNVDDAFPLKEYLLKHEDSRMAWYLLGKQYEAKGDTAKATYCFGQAGDIYTAFEGKPAPALPDPQDDEGGSNRKAFWIWTSVFVVLIGAIGLGVYAITQQQEKEATPVTQETKQPSGAAEPTGNVVQTDPTVPAITQVKTDAPLGVVSAALDPKSDGRAVLGAMLVPEDAPRHHLMVQAVPLGEWNDWLRSGKPLASVVADGSVGASGVDWLDPKWCNCKPHDAEPSRVRVQQWKPLQEYKLALRSAIVQYRARTGAWPANPDALNGDYPANTIAGWSEAMTPWFDDVIAELTDKKDGKLPTKVGWPAQSGPDAGRGMPAGAFAPLAEQPLEIIVDKTSHRLAVVSGDIIIRNYEVGLGGDRTPERTFVISEKVRNPNGTDQGKFGSRGMTLSDTDYGIHGTDKPGSLGKDESLGCVRMEKADVEELFDLVPLGTKVTISKGGLPSELRAPAERFKLSNAKDETNPRKVYDWLD